MVHPSSPGDDVAAARLTRIHLCTGLLVRGDDVLLVASRYRNHTEPLWNLPGGRQRPRELARDTVAREVAEETGLRCDVGDLLYVSESYDGDVHITNLTFRISADGEPRPPRAESDHVVAVAWVSLDELATRIAVRVVREPLLAHLSRTNPGRYTGYADAEISIEFSD